MLKTRPQSHSPDPSRRRLPSLFLPGSPGTLSQQDSPLTPGERAELLDRAASYSRSMHTRMTTQLHGANDQPSQPPRSSSYIPSPSYSYSKSKISPSPFTTPPKDPFRRKVTQSDPVAYTRIMHAHTLTQLHGLEEIHTASAAARTLRSESNTPVNGAATSRLDATQRLLVTDLDRLNLNNSDSTVHDDGDVVDEAEGDGATPCNTPFPGKKVVRRTTVASCARPGKGLLHVGAASDVAGRGTLSYVVRRDWAVAAAAAAAAAAGK